ncbi:mucin-2-like [Argopecten irradians]|uniref:mucin-2-like n=1 Tax=Argopecten irradians TaxID=31199 RepID=UPI00371CE1C8
MAGPFGSMVLWILFLGTTDLWNVVNAREKVDKNTCLVDETRQETVLEPCRDYIVNMLERNRTLDVEKSFPTPELKAKTKSIVLGMAGPEYYDMECTYIKTTTEKVRKCCDGWSPEEYCDTPICRYGCENEGTCVLPDVCSCPDEFAGYRCEDQMPDLSSNELYCYANKKCYGEKAPEFAVEKFTTVGKCCENGGTSWGVYKTYTCNDCSDFADLDNIKLNSSSTLSYGTCLAFGKSYYRTFDSLEYMFEGTCKYTLAQGRQWSIQIQSFECESACDCFKKVTIMYNGQEVVLYKGELRIEGIQQTVTDEPKIQNGVTYMNRLEIWTMVNTAEFKLKVDDKASVYLTVDKVVAEQEEILGLCGSFNRDRTDDFTMKSKEKTSNPATFGNSWNEEESFCPSAGTVQPCKDTDERSKAEGACDILRMNTFAQCRNYVDYSIWYQMCVEEYCKVSEDKKEELRCKIIGGYAHECAQHQIDISWRTSELCAPKCPDGLVYNECISPCQRSCSNLFADLAEECARTGECVSGCQCPPGLIKQDHECVPIEECKCTYQNKYYSPNEVVKDGCNECVCSKGQWDCTEEKCSETASITGAYSHVTTFDGSTYTLAPGPCTYTMTKVTDPAADARTGNLNIEISFTKCAATKAAFGLHCFHNLKVQFKSTAVEMRRDEIMVNAVSIDKDSSKYYLYNSATLYIKMVTSKFVMVKGFGFHILYDFKQTVYVTLDRLYVNHVSGLFGTYDDDMSNDLTMRNNIPTTSVTFFAGSWRSQCSATQTQPEAEISCEPDQKTISLCRNLVESEAFRDCILESSFPINTFIKWCEEDLCVATAAEQDAMFCEVTSAMSMECLITNKHISLDWYSYTPWDTKCLEYNRCNVGVYTECNTICEGHCLDVQLGDKTCIEMCVPGCKCADGTLFSSENNELTCVTIDECPCYDPYAETTVPAGYVATHGCTNCTCSKADWDCDNDNCDEDIECPFEQVYRKGISGCTPTCETLDFSSQCESEMTFDGCACPDNTFKTPSGRCVEKEKCPCKDNRNQYHESGATIEHSCKTYKCKDRNWVLVSTRDCPVVCTVSGGPHIKTFDEVDYQFDGDCEYYMARSIEPKGGMDFAVKVKRLNCGMTPYVCTRTVTVEIGNAKIVMIRGKAIEVNGNPVGVSYDSFLIGQFEAHLTIEFPFTILSVPDYELSVMWDGGTRVYVFVGMSWKERVDGLCGNYNKDSNDDKGTGPVSAGYSHANSYRTSTNCAASEQKAFLSCEGELSIRKPWAVEQCDILLGELFTSCHAEVAVETYYEECIYDACSCNSGGDCECLCTAIANYAEACSRKKISIEWRTPRLCPIMCEKGKIYTACMTPCHQTCQNIGNEPEPYCRVTQCVEGCICPEGFIEHDGECISADECPCYSDSIQHQEGDVIQINCQTCTCAKGKFVCEGEVCAHNCTEFMCDDERDCINKTLQCDSIMDCLDGSDEWDCVCDPGQFTCVNGQCIDEATKCNGMMDCLDGSDEMGCPHQCEDSTMDQFQCQSGNCIPMSFRCDGHYDCVNDEINCNYTGPCDHVAHFRCGGSGDCLPATLRCDGHDDCGDGSDEPASCQTTTSTTSTTTEMMTTTTSTATSTTTPGMPLPLCTEGSVMNDTEVSDYLAQVPVEITIDDMDGTTNVVTTFFDRIPDLSEYVEEPGTTVTKITIKVNLADVNQPNILTTQPTPAFFVRYTVPTAEPNPETVMNVTITDEDGNTIPANVVQTTSDENVLLTSSIEDLVDIESFVITILPTGGTQTYPSGQPSEVGTMDLDVCLKPATSTTGASTTAITTTGLPTTSTPVSTTTTEIPAPFCPKENVMNDTEVTEYLSVVPVEITVEYSEGIPETVLTTFDEIPELPSLVEDPSKPVAKITIKVDLTDAEGNKPAILEEQPTPAIFVNYIAPTNERNPEDVLAVTVTNEEGITKPVDVILIPGVEDILLSSVDDIEDVTSFTIVITPTTSSQTTTYPSEQPSEVGTLDVDLCLKPVTSTTGTSTTASTTTGLPTTSTPVSTTTTEIPAPFCPKENVMNDTEVTEYLSAVPVEITVEYSEGIPETVLTTFDEIPELPSLVEDPSKPVAKITIKVDLTDAEGNKPAILEEQPTPAIFVNYIAPTNEPNPEDVLTVTVTNEEGITKPVDVILIPGVEDILLSSVDDIEDVTSFTIVITPTTSSQTTTYPSEQPSEVGTLDVDLCLKPVTSTTGTSTTASTTTGLPTTSTPVSTTTTEIPAPFCPKENVMNDTEVTEYLSAVPVEITVEYSEGIPETVLTTFDEIPELPSLVEDPSKPVAKITIKVDLTDAEGNKPAILEEQPTPAIFVNYIAPTNEPNPEDVLTVTVTNEEGITKPVDVILIPGVEDILLSSVDDIEDVTSFTIVITPTTSSQTTTYPSEQPSEVGTLDVDLCLKPVTSTTGTSTTASTTTGLPTTSTPVSTTTTEIPAPFCPKENVMNDTEVTEYLSAVPVEITVEYSEGIPETVLTTFDEIPELPSLVEDPSKPVAKITIKVDLTDAEGNKPAILEEQPTPAIFVNYIAPTNEPNPEDVLTVTVTNEEGITKPVDVILIPGVEDILLSSVDDIEDVTSFTIVITPTTSSQTTTYPSEQPSEVGTLDVDLCLKPVTSTTGTSTTASTTTGLPTTSTPVSTTTTEIPAPFCPKENVMNDTEVTEYLSAVPVEITVEYSEGIPETVLTTFDEIPELPSLVEDPSKPVAKITIKVDLTDAEGNKPAILEEQPTPAIFVNYIAPTNEPNPEDVLTVTVTNEEGITKPVDVILIPGVEDILLSSVDDIEDVTSFTIVITPTTSSQTTTYPSEQPSEVGTLDVDLCLKPVTSTTGTSTTASTTTGLPTTSTPVSTTTTEIPAPFCPKENVMNDTEVTEYLSAVPVEITVEYSEGIPETVLTTFDEIPELPSLVEDPSKPVAKITIKVDLTDAEGNKPAILEEQPTPAIFVNYIAPTNEPNPEDVLTVTVTNEEGITKPVDVILIPGVEDILLSSVDDIEDVTSFTIVITPTTSSQTTTYPSEQPSEVGTLDVDLCLKPVTSTTGTSTTASTTTGLPTTSTPVSTTTTEIPAPFCPKENVMNDTEVTEYLSAVPVEITVEYSEGIPETVLTTFDEIPELPSLVEDPSKPVAKITIKVDLTDAEGNKPAILEEQPTPAIFVNYIAPINEPNPEDVLTVTVTNEEGITKPVDVILIPGVEDILLSSVDDIEDVTSFTIVITPTTSSQTTTYPSEQPSEVGTLDVDLCLKPVTSTTGTSTTASTTTGLPTTSTPVSTTTTEIPAPFCPKENVMNDTEVTEYLSAVPVEITVEYSEGIPETVLTTFDEIPELPSLVEDPSKPVAKITIKVDLTDAEGNKPAILEEQPTPAIFVNYIAPTNEPNPEDVLTVTVTNEEGITKPVDVILIPGVEDILLSSVDDIEDVTSFTIVITPTTSSQTTTYPSEQPSEVGTLDVDLCFKPVTTTSLSTQPTTGMSILENKINSYMFYCR